MALSLSLVIAGQVSVTTVRLLANGVNIPISATGAYSAEVPLVNGIVSLTSIDAAGAETVRTIQLATTGGVSG
jgi:hypothetical protein